MIKRINIAAEEITVYFLKLLHSRIRRKTRPISRNEVPFFLLSCILFTYHFSSQFFFWLLYPSHDIVSVIHFQTKLIILLLFQVFVIIFCCVLLQCVSLLRCVPLDLFVSWFCNYFFFNFVYLFLGFSWRATIFLYVYWFRFIAEHFSLRDYPCTRAPDVFFHSSSSFIPFQAQTHIYTHDYNIFTNVLSHSHTHATYTVMHIHYDHPIDVCAYGA